MNRKFPLIIVLFLVLFFSCHSLFAASRSTNDKTVADLVAESRYLLDAITESGTTDPMFPDAFMEVWVNNGIKNVASWTHCVEDSERHILNSGTSEYAMTSNYITIKKVMYQSGATDYKSLTHGTDDARGKNEGNVAHPEFWYEGIGTVGVYPLQDAEYTTVTGNTIYVTFVPTHTTLAAGDTVTTPQQYNDLIVYYTVAKALFKDRKLTALRVVMELYAMEADRYRQDFIYKPKKSLDEVVNQ